MSLTNIKESGGKKKNFGRIDEGTFVARVAQLIDLGVQEDEYEGERKVAHKIFINFEFPTEMMEIEGEQKPRWVGKEFGVSLHEKATLTKLVQSADPDGKLTSKGRNLKGLMGLPLMVTIGSTKTGNAKIAGMARLMKGLQVAELSKDPVFFDMDSASKEDYEVLPQWIQDKIKAGLDFNDTVLAKALGMKTKEKYEATPGTIEDMVSDSPY